MGFIHLSEIFIQTSDRSDAQWDLSVEQDLV